MCRFRIVDLPLTNEIKEREDGTRVEYSGQHTESGGVAADNTRRLVSDLS